MILFLGGKYKNIGYLLYTKYVDLFKNNNKFYNVKYHIVIFYN